MPYSWPQNFDRARAQRRRHLLVAGGTLAAMAGFVNAVVLGFFLTPVSHMSGAVSHLGLDLAQGRPLEATASLVIVLGFLTGSMLAGLIVGAVKLSLGRRYSAALWLETLLLGAGALLLSRHLPSGLALVALACGLQNAMSSSYCGLAVRTTHVTGVVTDIGVMLGHWLRHRQVDAFKLRFLLLLLLSFGAGGWGGAMLDQIYGPICLLLPCIVCAGLATACSLALRANWNSAPATTALDATALDAGELVTRSDFSAKI